MYEYITGELQQKDPGSAVVEAGGIGYRIQITVQDFDKLPVKGQRVTLWLHKTLNTEQGLERLYGFLEPRDRVIFRELLEVQRVGPSVALRILSAAGVETLVNAISGGDVVTLKRFKGVGAKMAERLVVELREPLEKLGLLRLGAGATSAGPALSTAARDALSALVTLGYRPVEAEKAVAKATEELAKSGRDGETSELIRAALKLV